MKVETLYEYIYVYIYVMYIAITYVCKMDTLICVYHKPIIGYIYVIFGYAYIHICIYRFWKGQHLCLHVGRQPWREGDNLLGTSSGAPPCAICSDTDQLPSISNSPSLCCFLEVAKPHRPQEQRYQCEFHKKPSVTIGHQWDHNDQVFASWKSMCADCEIIIIHRHPPG